MKKERGGGTMGGRTVYGEYMKDEEFARLIAQEDLIMDVTEGFCKILEEEKLSRSKLAGLMGKTKGYISQLLGGKRNITLRVMSDIAYHLGYNVKIVFRKGRVQQNPVKLKLVYDQKEQKPRTFSFREFDSAVDACVVHGTKISRMGI
jgi:transcriptional regulator with XRE-family HTH domain